MKARLKNVGGTTPRVEVAESLSITECPCEGLDGCDTSDLVRCVIVDVGGMS
jgi:hypothetical protein